MITPFINRYKIQIKQMPHQASVCCYKLLLLLFFFRDKLMSHFLYCLLENNIKIVIFFAPNVQSD